MPFFTTESAMNNIKPVHSAVNEYLEFSRVDNTIHCLCHKPLEVSRTHLHQHNGGTGSAPASYLPQLAGGCVETCSHRTIFTRPFDFCTLLLAIPELTDRAYYPPSVDIRNHIYKAQQACQLSKLDQEIFN